MTKPTMVLKTIWVTFQKEGIHKYPEALTNPDLADVSFLGYPHRHIFHFRVEVPVEDSNREIEFIQLKRWCESLYDGGVLELDYQSCEMIAEDLGNKILEKYPHLVSVYVSVAEDNENGAVVRLVK